MKKIITLLIILSIIIFCVEIGPSFRGVIDSKVDILFQGETKDAEGSFNG